MPDLKASFGSGWSIKINYDPKTYDELVKTVAFLKKQLPPVQLTTSDKPEISATSDIQPGNGEFASTKQIGKLWIELKRNGFKNPEGVFAVVFPDQPTKKSRFSPTEATTMITFLEDSN